MNTELETREGGCTCKQVRYRLESKPIFVHCCHCSWCQRETGSAFALNAMIEVDRVKLTQGQVDMIHTPSASGRGQQVARCPECRVAVWSFYSSDKLAFVRVGTLDNPAQLPPDVHIFTSTKQPWVQLPEGTPAFAEFYNPRELWPDESKMRYKELHPERV